MLPALALVAAVVTAASPDEALPPPPPPPVEPAPRSPEAGQTLQPFSPRYPHRFRVPPGPVPEGYRVFEQRKWGVAITGGAMFLTATVAMVAFAVLARNPIVAIPLVGPAVAAGQLIGRGFGFSGVVTLLGGGLIAGCALQVAGTVMLITGLTGRYRWLERTGPGVTLIPGAAGAPLGASLAGRF